MGYELRTPEDLVRIYGLAGLDWGTSVRVIETYVDLSRLWDAVALYAAIVAVQESGWPWPKWITEIIPDDE